jgi:uncharacterized protein YerC
MGEDYNINIRNGMGGGGKSAAQQKLSGKGSISKAKNTMNATLKKQPNKTITKVGKIGGVGSAISFVIQKAEQLASLHNNLREAATGNELEAQNTRNTIKTVMSLGLNYVYGMIENELFTQKTISRQNAGLEYSRELYDINVNGSRTKRV